MIRFTKLALASTFAIGLALPALAQTTTTPAPDQAAPSATTDSGIKPAAPEAAPAMHTKLRARHVKHTRKVTAPAPVKS